MTDPNQPLEWHYASELPETARVVHQADAEAHEAAAVKAARTDERDGLYDEMVRRFAHNRDLDRAQGAQGERERCLPCTSCGHGLDMHGGPEWEPGESWCGWCSEDTCPSYQAPSADGSPALQDAEALAGRYAAAMAAPTVLTPADADAVHQLLHPETGQQGDPMLADHPALTAAYARHQQATLARAAQRVSALLVAWGWPTGGVSEGAELLAAVKSADPVSSDDWVTVFTAGVDAAAEAVDSLPVREVGDAHRKYIQKSEALRAITALRTKETTSE